MIKQIALILILTLLIPACGKYSSDVQQAAGGVWQAQLLGGSGDESGFSFVVQFTVSGTGGALTFSSFQFLTSGACFPVNNLTPSGAMQLTVNTNDYQVTGTFNFAVTANGNTLTLSGTVTGTENGLYGTVLSGASVTGTWTLTGSGSGCTNPASGSFTMSQTSTSST